MATDKQKSTSIQGNAGDIVKLLQQQYPDELIQLEITGEDGADRLQFKTISNDDLRKRFQELPFLELSQVEVGTFKIQAGVIKHVILNRHYSLNQSKLIEINEYPAYIWSNRENPSDDNIFVMYPEGYVCDDNCYFYEATAFASAISKL